jgi:hypothetical protein
MVPGITSKDVQNSPLGATDSGKMQINVDGQQVTQNSASTSFGQPIFSDDAQSTSTRSLPTGSMPPWDVLRACKSWCRPSPARTPFTALCSDIFEIAISTLPTRGAQPFELRKLSDHGERLILRTTGAGDDDWRSYLSAAHTAVRRPVRILDANGTMHAVMMRKSLMVLVAAISYAARRLQT